MANITKRGNAYSIRCSAGFDVNGKRLMKTMTWAIPEGMSEKKAEKEAQRQAILFEERVKNGEVLEGRIRFVDFVEQWFRDYAEIQLRPRTIASYREAMIRINQSIGHLQMEKIRPQHLIRFYNELTESIIEKHYRCKIDFKSMLKKKNITTASLTEKHHITTYVLRRIKSGDTIGLESAEKVANSLKISLEKLFEEVTTERTLSDKTRRNYHAIVSSILSWAVKWQIINSNPAERVQPPKVHRKEAVYLDDEQAIELLGKLECEPLQQRTAIEVLLYTGMRRGELLGLKWCDIDFEKEIISIRRSVLYIPKQGVFEDETKNASSVRTIRVSGTVLTPLLRLKALQAEERLSMGDAWHNGDWVFTTWDGHVMRPDFLTRWFYDFVKRKGLPDIHLHSLRHTNATLLIASGTNLQTVAGRLGHANPSTTTKIYGHAIRSAEAAAVEALDVVLHKDKTAQ